MEVTTNPNIFVLLDQSIPTLLGQPFGFTIGQTTGFLAITSFVLFFILAADGVAAFGRILYALGLRVANSDNEAKLTVANKIISSTLFSLFFSYSLVLLFVTVVNPDLVTGNADFGGVVVDKNKSGTPAVTPASNPLPKPNGGLATSGKNEEELRTFFKNNGNITVNNEPCTSTKTTGCTNVAGLPLETINMLVALKSTCVLSNPACEVIITGGTEPGHASHGIGYRPVDLRITSTTDPLYTFLKFNSNAFGEKKDKNGKLLCSAQYKWAGSNFMFCDEPENPAKPSGKRHWHAS